MNNNIQIKRMLAILLIVMTILSYKLIFTRNKFNKIKNTGVANTTKDKKNIEVEKYGYSDILEVALKNNDFKIKSINMVQDEKCNIQVDYSGDMKLLYSSLISLNESKSFLGINSININKEAKITTIDMEFKKNK